MKNLLLISFIFCFTVLLESEISAQTQNPGDPKFRLIVLADMGNEPDEMQQMVHLLMYNNELDLEGLIAVTGIWLRPDFDGPPYRKKLHPNLFHEIIDGYEQVYDKLILHEKDWHTPADLRSLVCTGQTHFGIDAVGDEKSSPGSKLITAAVLKEDPRPVYIVANAGSNTLAQALWDYRKEHTQKEIDAFVAKLIVYENGAQDDAGAWILQEFPSIHWIRSVNQKNAYGGNSGLGTAHAEELGPWAWKPFEYSVKGQHDWTSEHIQTGHGALGEVYPDRFDIGRLHFIEGGGTVPWIGLLAPALYNPLHPNWGGFSGRYTSAKKPEIWSNYATIAEREKEEFSNFRVFADTSDIWTDPVDSKIYSNHNTPVHRWRQLLFDDFKCRMDWCVEAFAEANHNPVALINQDASRQILYLSAKPGEKLKFDASGSYDPDQEQKLSYHWFIYPEAGIGLNEVSLKRSKGKKVKLLIPDNAAGSQIHLILDVSDNSPIAPMHDVRRVVIQVQDDFPEN
jgi:hypothetical protein